ncbi:hypothetical protein [Pseudoroseicyclus aestuarii]|uniref:Uncharacterized protein n=1 Tax=Pseudoroseicyclus aestuarii TaxID=1795041 RepID=A0A318SSP0_9RHOB|nr:hypothetical protein [Pseudoroseicyclus aestuarii]PYE84552.1 hypothetical protein DFP88_102353 [Pseudoroseicyclus aestuarii]
MPRLFPAVALALSVALPAQQAAALSCLAPDPLRSLQEAAASDETYRVLLGRLDFDAEALPVSGPAGPVAGLSEAPLVRAEFEGHALGAEGFDTAANGTLAIEPGCLGEVCGNAVPGEEVLIFARVTEAGMVIDLDPCQGWLQPAPSDAQQAQMAACVSGGEDCPAAD